MERKRGSVWVRCAVVGDEVASAIVGAIAGVVERAGVGQEQPGVE